MSPPRHAAGGRPVSAAPRSVARIVRSPDAHHTPRRSGLASPSCTPSPKGGLSPEDAYNALEALRNMAAANLIARFESKLDAQNAIIAAQNARLDSQKALFESKLDAQNIKLDAQNVKLDAQDTKLKMLMWMIGAAVAVLGILVRLWG